MNEEADGSALLAWLLDRIVPGQGAWIEDCTMGDDCPRANRPLSGASGPCPKCVVSIPAGSRA